MRNWKRKGERLFRSGRSYLAVSVYQRALKKLELLDDDNDLDFIVSATTLIWNVAVDERKMLFFEVEACLAAANLKSQNYKEVVAQTDSTFDCNDERHSRIYHSNSDYDFFCSKSDAGWAEQRHKLNYARILYCRAMALYHLGNIATAVEHMEEALRADPGDNTAFEKLTMLKQILAKQTLEKEATRRKERLDKLNKSQIQLRKKQARRRAKA